MKPNVQGWLTVAAIIVALGIVGYLDEQDATAKTQPVTYHF